MSSKFRNTKNAGDTIKKTGWGLSTTLRAGLLALCTAALVSIQCSSVDQCRKEKDDATLCGLLSLDFARQCSAAAAASGQSSTGCFTPVLGAALLCPLTVSDACD